MQVSLTHICVTLLQISRGILGLFGKFKYSMSQYTVYDEDVKDLTLEEV